MTFAWYSNDMMFRVAVSTDPNLSRSRVQESRRGQHVCRYKNLVLCSWWAEVPTLPSLCFLRAPTQYHAYRPDRRHTSRYLGRGDGGRDIAAGLVDGQQHSSSPTNVASVNLVTGRSKVFQFTILVVAKAVHLVPTVFRIPCTLTTYPTNIASDGLL